eukprot:SAG31_NODE_9918_length_1210_cov_1.461746_1_plen_383_part_10
MTRRELILSILLALNLACLFYVGMQYGPLSGNIVGSTDPTAQPLTQTQKQMVTYMKDDMHGSSYQRLPDRELPPLTVSSQRISEGDTSIKSLPLDLLAAASLRGKPTAVPSSLLHADRTGTAVASALQNLSATVHATLAPASALASRFPSPAPAKSLTTLAVPVVKAPVPVLEAPTPIEVAARRIQTGLRAPADARSVVVMGSRQMLRRDKVFYTQAFQKIGFEVVDAVADEWTPLTAKWTGLLCLSLSDGEDKCMPKAQYPLLLSYQRISRLPGLRKSLWNKDAFCYTLKTMTAKSPVKMSDFSFDCWVLPTQFTALMDWGAEQDATMRAEAARIGSDPQPQQYIVKPFSAGEGSGIHLAGSASELDEFKDLPRIVQPYLSE